MVVVAVAMASTSAVEVAGSGGVRGRKDGRLWPRHQ